MSDLEDRIARILLLHDVSNESAPTFPEIADLCESAARAVIDGLGLRDQWGVLLDDTGSMDLYDEESEAREWAARHGGDLSRSFATDWEEVE